MKILNKQDNKIEFTAKIDESLANAIRRYFNQIPIIAVNELDISKNDSPLYDETIAHRVGLIPLKMEKSADKYEGVKLKLKAKKEGVVYSEELKGDISPVYDKIPITHLKKDQELDFIATVKIGKGADHPKFSPGLMFYRNAINIEINKECPTEVVDLCPMKIFESKNGKIITKNEIDCDMCEVCIELCSKKDKKDSIKLVPSNELVLTIESWGQLPIDKILKYSISKLKKDLNEVSKQIS